MSQIWQTTGSCSVMNGLPRDYVQVHFHCFQQLRVAAKQVLDTLNVNHGDGLVGWHRVPIPVRRHCRPNQGGPTAQHDSYTSALAHEIDVICRAIGVPRTDMMFGKSTIHTAAYGSKGKEPDECIWPPTRQHVGGRPDGWPTLVIETGVSESITQLRQDA
ncbi:uncharacterized protein ATNIH1004_000438 [Aspergillus tanneri]|uniref:Uncharacterized protein n=1 Tax=Aspergillus tanneri TaxID=1220188 RepID=A0A5M9MXD8_9EURO|nr:uncharacterized protein ATNIH1004_000438 [Aspergillus tanneri]KAA8651548.1 hypothetical protein ATNIH1004_000438 [Aspergillus tanneri]